MHERYRSALNRDVPLARPGEFAPLAIGPLRVEPPVVLAPMAGVTNAPFRSLCRRFGAGLYVSEMITARALVEGDRKTQRLASFAPDETPRSLQLYGVDPKTVGEAVGSPRRRGPRRSHRPQLRLPGAEGHAPRRRRRDSGEAAPAREHRARRGRARGLRPGHAEVPHRRRRRAGHVPRRRPHRRGRRLRGRRAARAHRRPALRRRRRLGGRDAAQAGRAQHPGARQRRHLRGARRAADDAHHGLRRRGRRARLPRPALAVPRPRGRVRGPRARRSARARRRLRRDARARAPAQRLPGRRAGAARLPQARGLVHQGVPEQRAPAPAPAPGVGAGGARRDPRRTRPGDALPARGHARAARQARRHAARGAARGLPRRTRRRHAAGPRGRRSEFRRL